MGLEEFEGEADDVERADDLEFVERFEARGDEGDLEGDGGEEEGVVAGDGAEGDELREEEAGEEGGGERAGEGLLEAEGDEFAREDSLREKLTPWSGCV